MYRFFDEIEDRKILEISDQLQVSESYKNFLELQFKQKNRERGR